MWDKAGKLQDTKAVIPDRCYAGVYQATIDFCKENGAKEVLTIEINKDLQEIVKRKSTLIGDDFFQCKPEQVSHINAIYMNPPFSNADKHILHAWEVAPEGCEIVSLCNYSTITQPYGRLKVLIRDNGITENLGDCFTDAERKTGVEVGLVRLFKPLSSKEFEFEGFFSSCADPLPDANLPWENR